SQGDFSTNIEVSSKSEFRDLADAFNNMTRRIQEMIEQKQRLIADVSHELRSPLTRMRLSLEILSKDPLGRAKYIDKSIAEIENLNRMIESILEISKLELDNKMLNLEVVDLKVFLNGLKIYNEYGIINKAKNEIISKPEITNGKSLGIFLRELLNFITR
ncbi:hypothetical protein EON73_02710, partial [bacterium]